MLLKRLELQNYGLYHGHHVIDFPFISEKQPITLIGGLNGRGKTTILEAVFLVLYGKRAIRYLQDERISYADYLYNHINKSALDQIASITLTMTPDDDGDAVTIQRAWSYGKSAINDNFVALKAGERDAYLSDNWDYYVEEILPLNISRFFFFDGEKIAQIADDDSFESVKDPIKSLLGLTTVDQLIADINKMLKRISTRPGHVSDGSTKLAQVQLEVEQCEKESSDTTAKIGRLRLDLAQLKKQNAELEADFWSKGGPLGLKREEMQSEKKQLSDKLENRLAEVDDRLARSLTPLLLCRPLLERTYNQVQSDDLRKSSKQFGDLLSQLTKMLSASSYDEKAERIISDFLDNAKEKFTVGFELSGAFELAPASRSILDNLIGHAMDDLDAARSLLNEVRLIENQLALLEINLNFEVEASDIKITWEKMRQLSTEIMQIDSQIAVEEEKLKSLANKMDFIEKRRLSIINDDRQDVQSEDELDRIARYATISIDVMKHFKIRLQQERVKELERQIFECFTFIGQKQQMIQRIEISPETLDIKLIDYTGGPLQKSQLSAGEKQIFAVSILWGLAKASGYQMPVIVDTPLGRLDSHHRTNFLSSYLPYASKQVIVLSTDEEINGKYYDLIEPYINSVYLLEYNEAMKSTFISNGYFQRYVQ